MQFAAGIFGTKGAMQGEMGHRIEDTYYNHVGEQAMLQAAKSFDEQTGFSHHVNQALHAAQEESFRTASDSNQNFVRGLDANFEQANHLRQEAQANFTKSVEFREMATFAKDEAATINSNANNEFVEWLANQPGAHSQGRMGISQAEAIINHNPELTNEYANQFIHQHTQSWGNDFQSGVFSPSSVQNNYEANTRAMESLEATQAVGGLMEQRVSAETDFLKVPNDIINKQVTAQFQQATAAFATKETSINTHEHSLEKQYQQNQNGAGDAIQHAEKL